MLKTNITFTSILISLLFYELVNISEDDSGLVIYLPHCAEIWRNFLNAPWNNCILTWATFSNS